MIQAVITIKVSSQHQLNSLIQALKALMVSARAERGLLDCKLYQLVGEETAVCFVEHWQGTDDLENQMRSDRYTQLLALMENIRPPTRGSMERRWLFPVPQCPRPFPFATVGLPTRPAIFLTTKDYPLRRFRRQSDCVRSNGGMKLPIESGSGKKSA